MAKTCKYYIAEKTGSIRTPADLVAAIAAGEGPQLNMSPFIFDVPAFENAEDEQHFCAVYGGGLAFLASWCNDGIVIHWTIE